MNFIIKGKIMDNNKMAITPKGLKYLLAGLLVMISGYILMIGGGSDDPAVFNYAMFDPASCGSADRDSLRNHHRDCGHHESFQGK